MLENNLVPIPDFRSDFDALLRFVEGDCEAPSISAARLALVFSLDIQSFATMIHANTCIALNTPCDESFQINLRKLLDFLRTASDMSGSIETAVLWMKTAPISAFEQKTSLQLFSEGRTGDVMRYLASFQQGFVG